MLSIDPKVRPSAPPWPVPTVAGRLTAKFGLGTWFWSGDRPAVGVCCVRATADEADARGESEPGLVAARRAEGDVTTPLDTDVAGEAARGLHDAGLDEDLRGLRVEGADELLDLVEVAPDVAADEHVGALVDGDRPARGEQLLGPRFWRSPALA